MGGTFLAGGVVLSFMRISPGENPSLVLGAMMASMDVIFLVGDIALGRSLRLSALVPATTCIHTRCFVLLPGYNIQCLQWWSVSNDLSGPLLGLTDAFWRYCLELVVIFLWS